MDSKYKTLIPLIIIFFILGAAVGYMAYQPKIVYVNQTVEKIVTVTVTVTPMPTPTLTPTPTPAMTVEKVADFTVKNYDPYKDTPTKTIAFENNRANPSDVGIKLGDTVLFKVTDYTTPIRITLILNESTVARDLSYSGGAVVVTFNNKGIYSFKSIIPSGDPNIVPRTYAEGTVAVS